MSLARRIEDYLKQLLKNENYIELQRSELAQCFHCVPSQINYVLSTRFSPVQGYLVESRRGGGGYLRIIKLSWEDSDGTKTQEIYDSLGPALDQFEAEGFLKRLREEGIISLREYFMLKAIVDRDTLQLDLPGRDIIRARILQAALASISRNDI